VTRGLLRSDAATIFGDYLFGEFDRHGHSFLGSLVGPTYGEAENLMNLVSMFEAWAIHDARGAFVEHHTGGLLERFFPTIPMIVILPATHIKP
jgi:hypothetical protein